MHVVKLFWTDFQFFQVVDFIRLYFKLEFNQAQFIFSHAIVLILQYGIYKTIA